MTDTGQTRIPKQQSPAWRQIRVTRSPAAQSPDQINKSHHHRRYQRHPQERMREAAVMGKPIHRTPEPAKNIEVGRLGSQRHRGRGQSRLAIESSPAERSPKEKVSDWFHKIVCGSDTLVRRRWCCCWFKTKLKDQVVRPAFSPRC